MNTENSKTSEPHKFVLNLLQRLDLKSLNKHIALQNLRIYNIRKIVGQQYKNNKLKIIFHGIMTLNFLTVLIQCQILKIIKRCI